MRPRGSYGDVAQALCRAAQAEPGTVRVLAQRACVSYATARYTASRLVDQGQLVVLEPGRPAVLSASARPATSIVAAVAELERCLWPVRHAGAEAGAAIV